MVEAKKGEIPQHWLDDPDIGLAIVIMGSVKEEAGRISPGNDPESVQRRNQLASLMIDQAVERLVHSNHNG
ncbi:hypothetical protein A3B52_03685 [Candidatus Curtissbacteria bacterium RIFCSPLOWO2_01_FULL_41_28]|uniref:Uncharacterized protein n=1 Tax=Candidatus Curtissbacteria bacterium RIFOXYA1_FULL_41_14 TaxID=1797737 RepID=A0A1F5HBH3_9BACT|nr:MAG: hypothetical protein A2683_01780 [Candidatus Curtissbacteria bacterium RIFCSPHIGHO2_01_FULL_34_40]OGD92655.1 MAG: hypothetical protein A3E14_02975 [Candidatus Curtissbacteria bacterium RIFCSPHIGHO2_12_FULL_41_13]OGD95525.1 MAG: hypothetical protein A3B52_03685 [Candidatus Curtissbacteria bacterium RIFCSPLOWO2_01_FULL_41_28]OGE01395.1 MAG: hypothetical protein A2196_04585 [Candidatus Curtissbacteria bacterium RIFOXYA1_FULL_41_14]OGE03988.1 MAG: hypothetical protein A2362_00255 [Candidatu